MESNTETIAKRARVGPRTQMLATIEKLSLMKISSISCRRSPIISLSYILNLLDRANKIKKWQCYEKVLLA